MSSTPKGGVIASAALPGSPQIRTTNLRGGKRSPSSRRHRERSIAGVPANSHHKFAGWQAISSQMEIATGLRPSQRARLLRPSGPPHATHHPSHRSPPLSTPPLPHPPPPLPPPP